MIPPRRILAAVDFSPASRAALAFASALAGRASAQLHVLYALDAALADAAGRIGADLIGSSRRDLDEVTRAVCPPERRRLLHVVVGEAAAVICLIAQREQADVVVLGTRGQSHGAAGHCGKTADAVVRDVTVPTMFVPESWQPPGTRPDEIQLGPVIAAVDGRQPAAMAANAAAALARLLDTTLELMHVGDRVPLLPAQQARSRVRLVSGETAVALADAAVPGVGTCPILVMGRRTRADGPNVPGSIVASVIAASRAPVLMYLPED
jgi:nucleotide-binding universal stress UspA family protein